MNKLIESKVDLIEFAREARVDLKRIRKTLVACHHAIDTEVDSAIQKIHTRLSLSWLFSFGQADVKEATLAKIRYKTHEIIYAHELRMYQQLLSEIPG